MMKDSATSASGRRITPSRALYLPPEGRPRWVGPNSSKLNLLYLGWGRRQFGKNPIPVSLHHGWVYTLVRQGNPILQLMDRTLRTGPRQMLVLGPDCPSGWTAGTTDSVSDLLTWVWHGPSRCEGLAPAANEFQTFTVDGTLFKTLQQIHALCRREVERPDVFSGMALDELRLRMDIALARSLKPHAALPESALRFELAVRWLAQNPAERNPVAALCDYLQVSPVTINRLFQTHLHESVSAYHAKLKMKRASQLLKSGQMSIKETAYHLGYRHSNDFSRAFRRHTGRKPSTSLPGRRTVIR